MPLILITKIKLSPDDSQKVLLKEVLNSCSKACNWISKIAYFSNTFSRISLQKLVYYDLKKDFGLTAQMALLCIHKVSNDYGSGEKKYRRNKLRKYGDKSSIAYDDRVIKFMIGKKFVSIWTFSGRQKIPFRCSKTQLEILKKRKGQLDLKVQNGVFYLHVSYEIEKKLKYDPIDWLGVDLGIQNLAYDSNGESYTGEIIEKNREKYLKLRKNLQRKSTKNAKRRLCKINKKEANFKKTYNHTISKKIILKAKGTFLGIVVEDLTGIHEKATVGRKNRHKHRSWPFRQLRNFLQYKSDLYGVPFETVSARYTSRKCPRCSCIDKRNRKNRDEFDCINCGFCAHADYVGALNICHLGRLGYFSRRLGKISEKGEVNSPIAVPLTFCQSGLIGTASMNP